MTVINLDEIKNDIDAVISRIKTGEDFIVEEHGSEIARISAIHRTLAPRVLGSARGQIVVSEDFDDPLPQELMEQFYK